MDIQMTTVESPDSEHQPTSRRGFAKAAIVALAIAGFGAAALNGVLTGQGEDAEVSAERRRRRSGGRRRRSGGRRRRSGGRNSGGENSGSESSGSESSGSESSGSETSGSDD
jgi:hypothetical protein